MAKITLSSVPKCRLAERNFLQIFVAFINVLHILSKGFPNIFPLEEHFYIDFCVLPHSIDTQYSLPCSNIMFYISTISTNQVLTTQIAKFIGPTWGPPGSCQPQVGPMLAPLTLLPGKSNNGQQLWSLTAAFPLYHISNKLLIYMNI